MKLYNQLTKSVEEFRPAHEPVRVYVCGVTPYDTTHLGHAFTYISFDTIMRYVRWLGHDVRYVQNVTDVDDDIIRRSKELGMDYQELGNQNVELLQRNLAELNAIPPDVMPRATQEIPKIIEIVEGLLQSGVAYQREGNVYYRVSSTLEYGRLSGLGRDGMLELARIRGGNPDDPKKDDPLDFILWQKSAPDEPFWESPWGNGRPGWHIECSAMSMRHLGEQVDIHGGGNDLIYPHHESEIVQSENFSDKRPFVHFWTHTGMVGLDGKPMSKSLRNMVFVSELLEKYAPAEIRFMLLSHHYRSAWEYNEAELENSATKIRLIERAASASPSEGAGGSTLSADDYERRFRDAMDDDINAPEALKVIESLAESIVGLASEGKDVNEAQQKLIELCGVLGLPIRLES